MNESGPDPRKTAARDLARLFDLDEGPRPVWAPEELSAILKHQLAAPLHLDLGRQDEIPASIGSFADLLHHPHPPLQLLQLTQRFAKASGQYSEGPLPREIATLLYYASIVTARLRCDKRISRLDDVALRKGLEALVSQPWLDERTRQLLNEGLSRLE